MLGIKRKNIGLAMLAVLGFGYFYGMSALEINPFWKSQVALMPIQAIALLYVTYWRWTRNQES